MRNRNLVLEEQLNARLGHIHRNLQLIADIEAKAAWIGGFGANASLMPNANA